MKNTEKYRKIQKNTEKYRKIHVFYEDIEPDKQSSLKTIL